MSFGEPPFKRANWISRKRDKGGWTAALPLYPAEIPFLEQEAIEAIGDQELEAITASAPGDTPTVLAAASGGGGAGGGDKKKTSSSLSPTW